MTAKGPFLRLAQSSSRPSSVLESARALGRWQANLRRLSVEFESDCPLNLSRAMPAESQWDLLDEYLLNSRFDVAWIDTENLDEVAERFRVVPDSGVLCDLDTAFDLIDNDEQETLVWIGMHSPGWSVSVTMNRGFPLPEAASAGGRGILTYWHMAGLYEHADEGMVFYHDGEYVGRAGEEAFQEHARDLDVDDAGFREQVEYYLVLAGRITGRFLDRDWFATSRVLCRIPHNVWSR
ncbi:hypothetical protein [Nonomuraea wenchangensis]|uniref:hypothetical protein n=1 Tax=Nonomuraea wenchangensis TaxID=568860 RepID=UPI0033269864